MSPRQIARRALLALLLPALVACGAPDTTTTGAAQPSAAVATDAPPTYLPPTETAAAPPTETPPATEAALALPPTPSLVPGSPQWYSHVELSPTLRLVGEALAEQGATALALSDGLLVALSGGSGPQASLSLIDLSDPARPRVRGSLALPNANSLTVESRTAWVTTDQGLQAVDLSEPDKPVARGSVALPGYKSSVRARGQHAYVTVQGAAKGAPGALAVFDIGSPDQPRLLGQTRLPSGDPAEVELLGDVAYVADGAGLQIVDLSRPDAPQPLGRYQSEGAGAVAVSEGRIYLAGAGGVEMFDASNPAKPSKIDTLQVGRYGTFSDIQVAAGRVYLTDANFGSTDFGYLVVLDIRDPARPVEIGRATVQANAYGVALAGTRIAVAFGRRGLLLLEEQAR